MRVVRFYQSCSPPRLAILLLLLRQHLLDHLCLHFHVHCCLANFAKLFANVRAQCAPLDLNLGPSQLSGHRWTSTWDLPSSVGTAGPQPGTCPAQCALLDLNPVCTAGPQPGTCPAQCAPLDLNLGPSQLSGHRWTSTWGPSQLSEHRWTSNLGPAQLSVHRWTSTQCAPLDLNLGPAQLSVHRWTSTAR